MKVAAFVVEEEIEASITPYALMKEKIAKRNGAAKAFTEIAEFPAAREGKIGVVGSVAMEIVTGRPYTNAASDLDLLIRNVCCEESKTWYRQFVAVGEKYGVAVDVEVVLADGYGVKAAELFAGFSNFSKSSTVLGKSLRNVKLLNRQAVLDAMLARK